MKIRGLSWKVALNSFITIFSVMSLLRILGFARDFTIYGHARWDLAVTAYFRFMGIMVLPVLIFFSLMLLLIARRIEQSALKLEAGGTLEEREQKQIRSTLYWLPRTVLILNTIGFVVGFVLYVTSGSGDGPAISVASLIDLLGDIATAIVLGFAQNSLNNRFLTLPRQLLKVYSIEADDRDLTIFSKQLIFSIALIAFALSVFYSAAAVQFRHEADMVQYQFANTGLNQSEMTKGFISSWAESIADGSQGIVVGADDLRFGPAVADAAVRTGGFNRVFLLYLLFFLGVGGYAQAMVSRDIRLQMRQVIERLNEISGDEADLTRRIPITSFDEIGRMAHGMNNFLQGFSELMNRIRGVALNVAESAGEVTRTVDEAESEVRNLSESSREVLQGTEIQKNHAAETSSAISRILESLEHVRTSVDEQSCSVQDTSSAIEEMAANIRSVSSLTANANSLSEQLGGLISQGGESVEESIEAIKSIQDATAKVVENVGVISNIASQTTLLAMNAAIEAAHAGEAGRGFAVVADEVRKLSETSTTQSKQILDQTKVMTDRVTNGVERSLQAGTSLNDIREGVSGNVSIVAEIAAAMQEQSGGAQQIVAAIEQVVQATKVIQGHADNQKDLSVEVQHLMDRLVTASEQIRGLAENQTDGTGRILEMVGRIRKAEGDNSQNVQTLHSELARLKTR